MQSFRLWLKVLPSFIFFIATQAQLDFVPDTCVDSAGFNKCWSAATSTGNDCYARNCGGGSGQCTSPNNCFSTSKDPNCVSACVCVAYQSWINCALSSCWNQVYSCAYQNLIINALMNCPPAGVGVTLPYFPAPRDAPDSCSCNIGYVYRRTRTSRTYTPICQNHASNSAGYNTCTCCGISESVSTFYNECPNTDPAAITFFNNLIPAGDLLRPICQTALLPSFNCSDIGYSNPGQTDNAPFLNANNLPANGTQTLSNTGGSITSPISDATLTWTLGTGLVANTATAAPYQAPNAGATTGTGSGATATTSAKSGGNVLDVGLMVAKACIISSSIIMLLNF